MSTRANIKVIGKFDEKLLFYRHSDGYPTGALPPIQQFTDRVNAGEIRRNASQAAGWLVVIGHEEYAKYHKPEYNGAGMGWKVGSMEPATQISADIAFLYTIDLRETPVKVTVQSVAGWDDQTYTTLYEGDPEEILAELNKQST